MSFENLRPDGAAENRPIVAGQVAAFVLVGGTAAVCFAALSAALIELRTGIPDWVVSALCYAAFIVPVYLAHRRLSFRSDAPHGMALPRYVVVQLVALALAAIFSFVFYDVFHVQALGAALLVIGLTSSLNFMILRTWAFAVRR